MNVVAEMCIAPGSTTSSRMVCPLDGVHELEPSTIGAQSELLRHEVRRIVDRRLPGPEHCAPIAVGVVLERATPVPTQPIEAGPKFEGHADAGNVVE